MNIVWTCFAHSFTAMGVIANKVISELLKLGYNVCYNVLNPKEINPLDYPPEIQKTMSKEYPPDNSVEIMFTYPDIYNDAKNKNKSKIFVGYTGCDSTGGYASPHGNPWETICNEYCNYMLTPSDYSRKIMKNLGVKKDIYLFPHGVDLNIFKKIKREYSKPFTFVFTGELTKRKSAPDIIIEFLNLFGKNNNDYQLILRANESMYHVGGEYIQELIKDTNNIHVSWKNQGQEDLVSYMNKGHVYLCCTRADWFNMTIFEAMATGCPVIANKTNGYYEYLKDYIIPVNYTMEDITPNDHPYLLGQWNTPNFDEMKNQMKYVIDNYEIERDRSYYEIAPYIHEHYTWENVTKEYLVPFLNMIEQKHFSDNKKIIDFKRIICPNYK